MVDVVPVSLVEFHKISQIVRILTECGNDMDTRYGLKHWKNSFLKTILIVCYSGLKNRVYGVYEGEQMVATFQTRIQNGVLHFSKLAVLPSSSGKGIGAQCLRQIESMAKSEGCKKLECEVYCESLHALAFYQKRGFCIAGKVSTLKYTEFALEKTL